MLQSPNMQTTDSLLCCTNSTQRLELNFHGRRFLDVKIGAEGWNWVQELGWAPVLSSAKRVVHYSLGSMALGSLLVASIEMVRFIMEFIQKRLKLLEMAPGGCCLSILFCCAQCCLGCIEWTIKFINRNAYIVVPFIHPALGLGCERFTSYEQTIWKSQKKQDRYKSI